jgi:hypothetical protein
MFVVKIVVVAISTKTFFFFNIRVVLWVLNTLLQVMDIHV